MINYQARVIYSLHEYLVNFCFNLNKDLKFLTTVFLVVLSTRIAIRWYKLYTCLSQPFIENHRSLTTFNFE